MEKINNTIRTRRIDENLYWMEQKTGMICVKFSSE